MSDLQDITFAEGDGRVLAEKLKTVYEALRRASGNPSYSMSNADPIRLVQLSEAAILSQVNTDIDITGKSNLLYYAGEETIEHLGHFYGVRGDRLQPEAATTTIEYTLSSVRSTTTTIPAGYRTTPDNKIFFATVEPLNIAAGTLSGTVKAKCLTTGAVGNYFKVGEIKNIVDRSPFVQSAVNITESGGGSDLETVEAYKARIQLLPESFSVAGPDGAYKFWAMSANSNIIDVAVWSPEPVHVNVVPLMLGGEIPSQDVLDAVYEACNDRKRRPLTDFLHVLPPRKVFYNIDLSYWILREDSSNSLNIQASVDAAILKYKEWQSEKLGRDLNPSKLYEFIMNAGAKRVVVNEPIYTPLDRDEIGVFDIESIVYGGLENA